jgi:hypothetical protein
MSIFKGFGTETAPSEIATKRIMSDQYIAGFTIFGGTSGDRNHEVCIRFVKNIM